MSASLSEEQKMLDDSVRRLAADIGVTQVRDLDERDRAFGWQRIAEQGLLGIRTREHGAPLLSGVEVMICVEALANALAPQPFVGGIMASELLALANASPEKVEPLVAGDARYAILLSHDLTQLAKVTDRDTVAWDVDGADHVLGLIDADDGLHLACLPLDTGFVASDGADLTRRLMLRNGATGSPEIIGDALSDDMLARWHALALVALNADICGALKAAHAGALAYSKERIQYGALIGSFQAVQHMCAEMLVQIEAAAGLNAHAAWAVDALPPQDALLAARTAKAYCASVAQPVGETVMQVYGGIGQTWEHIAHLFTRRVMLDAATLGSEQHQLDHIAAARLPAAA